MGSSSRKSADVSGTDPAMAPASPPRRQLAEGGAVERARPRGGLVAGIRPWSSLRRGHEIVSSLDRHRHTSVERQLERLALRQVAPAPKELVTHFTNTSNLLVIQA